MAKPNYAYDKRQKELAKKKKKEEKRLQKKEVVEEAKIEDVENTGSELDTPVVTDEKE